MAGAEVSLVVCEGRADENHHPIPSKGRRSLPPFPPRAQLWSASRGSCSGLGWATVVARWLALVAGEVSAPLGLRSRRVAVHGPGVDLRSASPRRRTQRVSGCAPRRARRGAPLQPAAERIGGGFRVGCDRARSGHMMRRRHAAGSATPTRSASWAAHVDGGRRDEPGRVWGGGRTRTATPSPRKEDGPATLSPPGPALECVVGVLLGAGVGYRRRPVIGGCGGRSIGSSRLSFAARSGTRAWG
jgi:hypothetical protein